MSIIVSIELKCATRFNNIRKYPPVPHIMVPIVSGSLFSDQDTIVSGGCSPSNVAKQVNHFRLRDQ